MDDIHWPDIRGGPAGDDESPPERCARAGWNACAVLGGRFTLCAPGSPTRFGTQFGYVDRLPISWRTLRVLERLRFSRCAGRAGTPVNSSCTGAFPASSDPI